MYILKVQKIKCSIGFKSVPPEENNTNTSDELEFVLFFFNDYFGLKVIRYKNKKINIKTDSRAMVRSAVS